MTSRTARVRQTRRLLLVPCRVDQTEDLFRLHMDDAIAEWYGGHWTREQARRRAQHFEAQWELDGISKWIAYDRRNGELVGRGGLSQWDFEGHRQLELGWALRGEYWGRGYATEIGQAGLEVAWTELLAEHVYAFTEPHNVRSRAVMDRLGMLFMRDIVWENEPFVLYQSTRKP